MPNRIAMPGPDDPRWGPKVSRDPETIPGWMEPYNKFLDLNANVWKVGRFRISFDEDLPHSVPGDHHGRTMWPWHIRLSLRVRGSLFMARSTREASLGAQILFRQVAYAEFWQQDWLWILRYWWNPSQWLNRAESRAAELMSHWRKFSNETSEKPPLAP